jgi:hypothetical protein
MEKRIKDYVLGCAKSQGKIAKLLMNCGEWDEHKPQYEKLMHELQLLKEELLKEDTFLAGKIAGIKKGGKINTGSCYTDPFGGWGRYSVPTGNWPEERNGMVYAYKGQSDEKPLPFGRNHIKPVGLKGQDSGFFK